MHKNFLRVVYALIYTLQTFSYTFKLWPIGFWLSFWFTNKPFKKINIDSYDFWVHGNNLLTKLADVYTLLENVVEKEYFKNSLDFSEDATVIDVGAHIGAFTVLAARKAKRGKIYAFEPLPENYELLERNILSNNVSNTSPYNLALAGSNQERTLYIDDFNSASNSLIKKSRKTVRVRCRTLAEVLIENKISKCNFLKMDCEGAEYEILLDTPIDILQRIDQIALEYHSPKLCGLNDYYALDKLQTHLRTAGYQTTVVKEDYRRGYVYALRK